MGTSRGLLVGSGPKAGNYQSHPVPSNIEDLPAYISDELLTLGGHVNDIKEGGALPPVSEMPSRFINGSMMYFINPIEPYITSAGIWLYKDDQWVKLADSPTADLATLNIYINSVDVPTLPPDNVYSAEDIAPWTYTIPEGDNIWISVAHDANISIPEVEWSEPRKFSGTDTIGWFYVFVPVASWAGSWPDNASDLFLESVGREPMDGDILTIQPDGETSIDPAVLTRLYNGTEWEETAGFIDGNAIVTGTIAGDKITANTVIQAPLIQGGEIDGGSINIGTNSEEEGYDINFSVDSAGVCKTNNLYTYRINLGDLNDPTPPSNTMWVQMSSKPSQAFQFISSSGTSVCGHTSYFGSNFFLYHIPYTSFRSTSQYGETVHVYDLVLPDVDGGISLSDGGNNPSKYIYNEPLISVGFTETTPDSNSIYIKYETYRVIAPVNGSINPGSGVPYDQWAVKVVIWGDLQSNTTVQVIAYDSPISMLTTGYK